MVTAAGEPVAIRPGPSASEPRPCGGPELDRPEVGPRAVSRGPKALGGPAPARRRRSSALGGPILSPALRRPLRAGVGREP